MTHPLGALEQQSWFDALDQLRVECDGMTRVLSALLTRDGVPHSSMVGDLKLPGVGRIPLHHWIALNDGRLIDLRARMWLGQHPRVPHGLFHPDRCGASYEGCAIDLPCPPIVFWALTDRTIDSFAPASFLRQQAALEPGV